MTSHDAILAWARSPGFAAIHNGAATDEQIADDLLYFLHRNGFAITPLSNADLDVRINNALRPMGVRSWHDTRQMTVRDLLATQGLDAEMVRRILTVTGRVAEVGQIG